MAPMVAAPREISNPDDFSPAGTRGTIAGRWLFTCFSSSRTQRSRTRFRRAFGPLGFSVTSVQAGEPALARCKESPPDLILLAAELPDMSGFSVCNRLKRALSSVPLVLYTAEATEAAIEAHRATRNRADDYVRKPFELADLLARAAALLQTDQPGPPPPPVTPPAAPRPDGRRPEDAPPVLSRVDSGQVAARGLAAAMQAASAPPTPPAIRAPSRPGVPAVSAPATPPGLPTGATAAPAGPPPVPGQRAPAAIGRVKVPALSRDAFAVLEEWPRDPAPPKGTPEEKLEYFRERLRVRDAFLAKIRDAIGEAKGVHAQLAGERDLLQRDLDLERDRALGLEGRAQEAAQDAAAQAARIDDLRRQLEESETTRQSLSDVLSETMQQHEAAEQQWSTRIAESDSDRARLEAEIADQAEAHARAVAALEADRADERARAEATRAEAEEAYARAAAATNEEREKERAEATGRQHLAEERVTALGVERDRLQAELVRVAEEQRARLAVLAEEEAARAQAAAEELGAVRARLDEATGRGEALEAELAEARARILRRRARGAPRRGPPWRTSSGGRGPRRRRTTRRRSRPSTRTRRRSRSWRRPSSGSASSARRRRARSASWRRSRPPGPTPRGGPRSSRRTATSSGARSRARAGRPRRRGRRPASSASGRSSSRPRWRGSGCSSRWRRRRTGSGRTWRR